MTFEDQARRGDVAGALRSAAIYGSLWAIGSAWSTGIRAIALLVLPEDTMDAVVAELAALGLVTLLGMGISFLAARCCRSREKTVVEKSVARNTSLSRRAAERGGR